MKKFTAKTAGGFLLLLFIVSGFAGLIYQSVWSHYLGLTLGHAAYAQSLVLAIFMGGMAIGAWFVSQRTPNWRRLILGYAIIEGLIGIIGLVFQAVFVWYTDFSQQVVLPALGSVTIAHLYQWSSAALLILPQCLLLGATFPLLSAGYLRIAPQEDGRVLGGLYFTNSLGAACGALVTTFVLLPAVGLPGSVLTAGLLNILVAIGAWLISRRIEGTQSEDKQTDKAVATDENHVKDLVQVDRPYLLKLGRIMLAATAISGATSFVYETGWIRLLNQALGSTIHSFELMLAAFILGLAFGGLWIRRYSHAITNTVRYVGYVQVFMGIAAMISVPIFAQSFSWVGWIMHAVMRNDSGYLLYEWATVGISLLVMFPAAFFAGMTLPLFTMSLLRAGAGERAIGRIYAANTLGSIAGVVIMIHVLIPLLGVKAGVVFAAMIDAVLGVYLLMLAQKRGRSTRSECKSTGIVGLSLASVAILIAFVGSLVFGRVDPVVQTSGVFRTGNTMADVGDVRKIPFLQDGKTATVGFYEVSRSDGTVLMGISTNGKPDAGMMSSLDAAPVLDEFTMVMLGAMPLITHPNPERIALIGWGSGLSTHTVLGSSVPKEVDTIEIESAMYEGARLFGSRVERAYNDPRSHVRLEDARTFFSMGARKYDVIVSEPSNPWVSGVASLFTREFYQFLHSHLNDGGVLVQWLHFYELNDKLLATMLLALAEEFPNAQIYIANTGDIIVVAYKDEIAPLSEAPWAEPELAREMARVGLGGLSDIQLRHLGSAELIRQLANMKRVSAHSDFFPVVSLEAPAARFKNEQANFLMHLAVNGLPVLDILECRQPVALNQQVLYTDTSLLNVDRQRAFSFMKALETGIAENAVDIPLEEKVNLTYALATLGQHPQSPEALGEWSRMMGFIALNTIGPLSSGDLHSVWTGEKRTVWLPDDVLLEPGASAVYKAYAAAAMREPEKMYQYASGLLEAAQSGEYIIHVSVKDQMLAIAMLGAIGSDKPEEAKLLFERYSENIPSTRFGEIRIYLYYWAHAMTTGSIAACQR